MLRWRSKRTGPKSRVFTYFTILGVVVAIAAIVDLTSGNARSGTAALIVAVSAIVIAEFLVWRFGD